MINIDKTKIHGWEPAIRGMRNPMNSWDKSDSIFYGYSTHDDILYCHRLNGTLCNVIIGPNDMDLMTRLISGGPVHCKFRRFITVYCDVNAPLYWWKEFKTYRSGRKFADDEPEILSELLEPDIEMNSCSTMHKIHSKPFEVDDFSHEYLIDMSAFGTVHYDNFLSSLEHTIQSLNCARELYLKTKDKKYWWQLIQLLPSSYNQKRTLMLNYEVLANMYRWRKDHKLDEWRDFCKWIESLPYAEELICNG